MGRIARLISFVRELRNGAWVSDVKSDPGGGPNTTAQHFADPGDDSHPLPDDYETRVEEVGTGRESTVGYLDPLNKPKAQPGDKRIYARDASTGAVVVELWLKNDSTAVLTNANGTVTLTPAGDILIDTPNCDFDVKSNGSIKGSNSAGSFELQTGGNFVVNNVTIDVAGNITTPVKVSAADMEASSSLIVNAVEMDGHVHPQGTDSAGDSQANTGGPQ